MVWLSCFCATRLLQPWLWLWWTSGQAGSAWHVLEACRYQQAAKGQPTERVVTIHHGAATQCLVFHRCPAVKCQAAPAACQLPGRAASQTASMPQPGPKRPWHAAHRLVCTPAAAGGAGNKVPQTVRSAVRGVSHATLSHSSDTNARCWPPAKRQSPQVRHSTASFAPAPIGSYHATDRPVWAVYSSTARSTSPEAREMAHLNYLSSKA